MIGFAAALLALVVILVPPLPAQAQPVGIVDDRDYDTDDDGLIEVSSLTQLNAIRWDLDGDGSVDNDSNSDDYAAAYPGALAGMGCPSTGCDGYELTADLDFNSGSWNPGQGWTPIGFGSGIRRTPLIPPFEAVFDGNGYTIDNLRINLHSIIAFDSISHGFVGLFSYAGQDAVIRNLGLESVDVSPSGRGVTGLGGLVGINEGTISNCYVTGRVSFFDTNDVGGLVGSNSGKIIASYATASVTGGAHTGGLVGWNHAGIYASYATGNVSGRGMVGGLVGNQSDGSATLLYGGGTRGEIVASYATGNVSGYNQIGGLAGNAAGIITASYSLGSVSTSPEPDEGFYDRLRERGKFRIGGLVSNCVYSCPSSDNDSYWNTQTSGQSSSPHGTGKTSSDLKQPTAYAGIYANWNVDVDGDGSPDDPWDFGTSSHYPVLKYGTLRAINQRGDNDDGEDTTNVGSLSFAQTAISVSEGGGGHSDVLVEVRRTGPTTEAVAFHLTAADGTATGGHLIFEVGDDYITLSDDPYSISTGATSAQGVFSITDDAVDEDDENFTVTITVAADTGYEVVGGPAVVTITDNDTAGVTVTAPNPLAVAEGGSNYYFMRLDSQPAHDVTITPASGDAGAATVSPASLTFTSANWYMDQGFAVTGVSDEDAQDERLDVSHQVASSDAKYNGIAVESVVVAVTDDDTPPTAAPGVQSVDLSQQPADEGDPGTGQPPDEEGGEVPNGEPQPEELEPPEEQEPEQQQARTSSLHLDGTDGPDNLIGDDGNDVLTGKRGDDVLHGRGGNDELRGGRGADELRGGRGGDTLIGGRGNDELYGDRGADRLQGGNGDDTLTGGPGKDRFIFVSGETGDKIITDFGDGDDLIVLKTEGDAAPWPSVSDIIAGVVAQGDRYLVYTLSPGLTVETDTPLGPEDFRVN